VVYAGGYFTGARDGLALPYMGRWDRASWSSMGSAGGLVYALAVGPNGVYAAGTYYTGSAYGSPFFNRWNGSTWNNMLVFAPDTTLFTYPLSDPVGYDAIAIQGNNVYLGGNIMGFTQFDPDVGFESATNCQNIIRFDRVYGWIMGTGVNGTNMAMAVMGSKLFVGGTFTRAGTKSSYNIARWNDQVNFDTPQLLNPTRSPQGQFQVRLAGVGGRNYIIEASTNLTTWIPVWTNTSALCDFTDPNPTAYPRRFFRAVLEP
jgi:hypothetical protein